MRLSKAKLEQVRMLLKQLPSDMTRRLTTVARHADPALARLLDYSLEGPDVLARRGVFEPLKLISLDPKTHKPSRALAPSDLLDRMWEFGCTRAPELRQDAQALYSNFDAHPEPGELLKLRARLSDIILQEVARSEDDPKLRKRVLGSLQTPDFEAPVRIAKILKSAHILEQAVDGLPDSIPDWSDELSATIRDRYEHVAEVDPDSGVWVLCVIMARMERPWRLLRVFERIARRGDDLLISKTDMGPVGDVLLDDAEFALSLFASAPATRDGARAAAQGLADFAAVTVGMTREIGIRKDGSWGQRLFKLRAKASDAMSHIHAEAREAVFRATPEAGGLKTRIRMPSRSGEPEFERALSLSRFLIMTKDDAARAAVGSAHTALIDELRDRVETLAETQLQALRRETGEDQAASQSRVMDIAELLRALAGNEAGDLLVRRATAALAA